MKKFITIDILGTLVIDKVLIESYCPILFTCINEKKELFLCTCCQDNSDGKKWLITKTTPDIIIDILKDRITLRRAFLVYKDVQFTVFLNSEGLSILENYNDDWDYETSIYLPDKDEYMEVEQDEFIEEISYYEDFLTNKYDPIKTGLTFDYYIDEKSRNFRINNLLNENGWFDLEVMSEISFNRLKSRISNSTNIDYDCCNDNFKIYVSVSSELKVNLDSEYNIGNKDDNELFWKAS